MENDANKNPSRSERSRRLAEKVKDVGLRDLAGMPRAGLEELYLLAETPPLQEVQGITDGVVCDGIIPFHKLSGWIPWRGKRFVPPAGGAAAGRGRNRMEIGRWKALWFPFATGIHPPLLGEDPVFTLDYSSQGNFWPIRIIRDDLKRLKDGLFLGAVFMKWTRDYKFMLYFALQAKGHANQGGSR